MTKKTIVCVPRWALEILEGEVGTATAKEVNDAREAIRAELAK